MQQATLVQIVDPLFFGPKERRNTGSIDARKLKTEKAVGNYETTKLKQNFHCNISRLWSQQNRGTVKMEIFFLSLAFLLLPPVFYVVVKKLNGG